jgi:GT2 family glycosyltransferase
VLIDVSDARAGGLQGAWLGQQTALLLWSGEQWRGRFRPVLDGEALRPPLMGLSLEGGALLAGLVRLPAQAPAHAQLCLAAASQADPADAPPWLPLGDLAEDPIALLGLLPDAAQPRLLRVLLEAGCGPFAFAPAAAARRLLHAMAAREGADAPLALPIAAAPDRTRLLRAEGPSPAGPLYLVGPARALRLPHAEGGAVHVLAEAPAPGEFLVGGGEAGWIRRVTAAPGLLPSLLDRLAAGQEEAEAIRLLLPACLGPRATEPAVAELLEAARCLAPARPRSRPDLGAAVTGTLELALPDGAGGLFLRGWLRDPHALVREIALAAPGAAAHPLAAGALHRFRRRELDRHFRRAVHAPGEGAEAFVAHLPRAGGVGPQPDLLLRLAGGATVVLTPALRNLALAQARDAVLASIRMDALTEDAFAHAIAPAAARLHAAHLALPRAAVVRRFGAMPRRPAVSVLIPLYRSLGFLRVQIAAFAADPAWREVETILVLDSPEQAAEAEHLLRGLHLMLGLPMILVVAPRNLGYAAANNLGAGFASGRLLLLLNSDVIPDRSGWLGLLAQAAAARGVVAAGPKLLFEDESVQHAGLTFERDAEGIWYNRHFAKGFPRHAPAATRPRAVPGVTGAALMLRRAAFERVGGITEDYVVGDYEDSDLCLKLREGGGHIRYVPEAELWHFERRSIGLHASYTATLASHYNRRLHHQRWDATIAALMRRFERADDAAWSDVGRRSGRSDEAGAARRHSPES